MTNRKPRGRKQRILIAGGVTENKNVFYRRDDSVLITVNQNKIICKSCLSLQSKRFNRHGFLAVFYKTIFFVFCNFVNCNFGYSN